MSHPGKARRRVARALAACFLYAALALPWPALTAAEPAARSVATYVSVEPGQDRAAAAILRSYAADTRRDAAATRVLVLAEIGRPGQFVLLESWRDEPAWNAHVAGKVRQALAGQLQALLIAPFDERVGLPMQAEVTLPYSREAVHVVLHVDVLSPGVDTIQEALREAARTAALVPGVIAYESAPQFNKRNHFTVHQVFASRAAYSAYVASAGAKEFRARFHQIKGAVYDDRLYQLLTP